MHYLEAVIAGFRGVIEQNVRIAYIFFAENVDISTNVYMQLYTAPRLCSLTGLFIRFSRVLECLAGCAGQLNINAHAAVAIGLLLVCPASVTRLLKSKYVNRC